MLAWFIDVMERLPGALDRVGEWVGRIPPALGIGLVGHVLAALLASSFLSYPDGSYFALSPENVLMLPAAVLTLVFGAAFSVRDLARGRGIALFLVSMLLCVTPFATYSRVKAAIFAAKHLAE